jgi:hypothetical protein
MTTDRTSAVADLVVAAIGAAAALYIMRTPPLRRLAWRLAKYAVGTMLPGYLVHETKRAWAGTASNRRAPAIMNG